MHRKTLSASLAIPTPDSSSATPTPHSKKPHSQRTKPPSPKSCSTTGNHSHSNKPATTRSAQRATPSNPSSPDSSKKPTSSANLHLWIPGLLATLVGVGLSLFNSALPPVAFFLAVWLTIWTAGCAFLLSSALGAFREKRWGPAFGFSLFSLPFLAGWVAGFWFFSETASTTTILLLVAGFAVNFLFYHLIKAPTHAGRDVLDDIEGFEKYLDDAGSDTSTSNVETFSRYLAYTIALDREEMLGDRFAAALADASSPASSALPTRHPHWYTGNIAASAFASSIGSSLTTSLASSAQSRPPPPVRPAVDHRAAVAAVAAAAAGNPLPFFQRPPNHTSPGSANLSQPATKPVRPSP